MIQYGAMQYYNWDLLEEEPLNALLGRKTIHAQNLTVARIRLMKGAVVPMHSHANEQISMLESGAVRFRIAGEERVLRAGDALVIPPDVPHTVEALEDSLAVDVFSPRREDWIRGDDAYLRDASPR
ncbi:MAG TPA: cupin domain-containing protein [Bryobacteraceae bacterium]|jgi:quercetin dioxygenase-like cupin family protein|nr:cupin domain-containing protein [Bryobacteraceae bacterium]